FVLKPVPVSGSYLQLYVQLRHLATHPIQHRAGAHASCRVKIQNQRITGLCIATARVASFTQQLSRLIERLAHRTSVLYVIQKRIWLCVWRLITQHAGWYRTMCDFGLLITEDCDVLLPIE